MKDECPVCPAGESCEFFREKEELFLCTHPENPNKLEGNVTEELCPLTPSTPQPAEPLLTLEQLKEAGKLGKIELRNIVDVLDWAQSLAKQAGMQILDIYAEDSNVYITGVAQYFPPVPEGEVIPRYVFQFNNRVDPFTVDLVPYEAL